MIILLIIVAFLSAYSIGWLLMANPVKIRFSPLSILKYRIPAADIPKITYLIRIVHNRLLGKASMSPTLREISPYSAIDVYNEDVMMSAAKGMALPICMGKDYDQRLHFADLSKLPHVLIAGLTGFGKSMCFQNFIYWLGKAENKVEVHAIDPNQTGFSSFVYSQKPTVSVAFEEADYAKKINDLVGEMNARNALMRKLGFKNIAYYNKQVDDKLPYIVLLINEFQDLAKKQQEGLKKLARMGRSAGMHLVLSTQNPNSIDIDPTILQQLSGIICFRLQNKEASKRVLGEEGAEKLAGKGEMIFKSAISDFKGRAPICELKDFDFYETYKKSQKQQLTAYKKAKKVPGAKKTSPKKN